MGAAVARCDELLLEALTSEELDRELQRLRDSIQVERASKLTLVESV
jgi:hypothetical protein